MPHPRDILQFLRAGPAAARCLLRLPVWAPTLGPAPDTPCAVPEDFFGVCVAPADDPAGDDYILDRLADLGVRQVRLDFAPDSFGGPAERLLRRLIAQAYDVRLHLALPRTDAAAMSTAGAQARWRDFLARTLDAFGGQADGFEIGSTVNRRAWSGMGPDAFLKSWAIAFEEAHRRNIRLAAPNVTDFEPIYNVMLLNAMNAARCPPDIHTTNLFVERATEPEAYDPKVLGRRLAGLGRFTLVRKARLLQRLGAWAGVPVLHSSHVSWSLRRIARILPDVEPKQADYLARYCLLAAASGALGRVYWGPLIGQREGLVDDGTTEFPDIPHVTFYGRAPGRVTDYRLRPAFRAFQTVIRLLARASFRRRLTVSPRLHILEFETPDQGRLHAAWTVNGRAALTAACYDPSRLAGARCLGRDGVDMPIPPLITETPIYLLWPRGDPAPVRPDADVEPDFRCHAHGPARFAPFELDGWRGFRVRSGANDAAPADLLRICLADAGERLRDSRNTVWRTPAPWQPDLHVVIKRFRPPQGLRRVLQAGKPNRARRSWNGAQELLRRGLDTPAPVAFLERAVKPTASECYYLCESFEGFSARQAFTAFRDGCSEFEGIPAESLYEQVAAFLLDLHRRGVFFRDLSAGNLLFGIRSDGNATFALIDTTRARFDTRPLGLWQRLLDLMRLCHPLHQAGRDALLAHYLGGLGRTRRAWMRLPFAYYDLKHRIKGRLRRIRRA
jgi:hypothetical protein